MLGRAVKTMVNQHQNAGHRSIIWDGTNDHGHYVSAGVYLYRIQAGNYTLAKKMVFLK
jgi:flagellar hook assembly protein FlgD